MTAPDRPLHERIAAFLDGGDISPYRDQWRDSLALLRKAAEDAARLDWLEANGVDLQAEQGAAPLRYWSLAGGPQQSLRDAIDAAKKHCAAIGQEDAMDASQVGNAYEHALRELATAQAENARMRIALEDAEKVQSLAVAYLAAEEIEARLKRIAERACDNYSDPQPELTASLHAIEDAMDARNALKAAIAERALTAGSGNE